MGGWGGGTKYPAPAALPKEEILEPNTPEPSRVRAQEPTLVLNPQSPDDGDSDAFPIPPSPLGTWVSSVPKSSLPSFLQLKSSFLSQATGWGH